MVSTRRLDLLPGIEELRRLCQSLAMLDAIIMPEWQYRYYSFDAQWGSDEMMASMRDGSGDHYYILFSLAGAIIKGFDHESPMASYIEGGRPHWPGVLDAVPPEFAAFLDEPAFEIGATSFCIWRKPSDRSWNRGEIAFPHRVAFDAIPEHEMTDELKLVRAAWEDDADGSAHLLSILDGDPRTYQRWAREYYADDEDERSVPLALVARVYRHEPLTEEIVAGLNAAITLMDVAGDGATIGYPVAQLEGA